MLRFSLLGFPVTIQWMFWVVIVLLSGQIDSLSQPGGLQMLGIWMAVVLISILWHELGHVLFQKKYGAQPEIVLWGGGGLAIPHGGRFTRTQSFIISAAGPAFGLMLWAFSERYFHYFPPKTEMAAVLRNNIIFVNLGWSILNLLPVIPLDGGRMLEALLGPKKIKITAGIGLVLAIGMAAYAFLEFKSIFMAIFFGFFAYQNFQILQQGRSSNDII